MDSVKMPALETQGLRKEYHGRVAVEDLSLTVMPGEVFGFLGPNGSGKTTSVKMLLGLVRPTAGRATLLGAPLNNARVRRRIGFLPEHFRFHEWLTAVEFLDFHARLYGMPSEERRRRIPEVLDAVGLGSRAHDRLGTFSRGMLQRIGLGQAIIHRPDLVFLDEPTSALDPLGRRDVRELIRSLRTQGTTVFLNSHLLSEVELVCDRVAIIDRGRVVRQGPIGELLRTEWTLEVRAEPVTPELMTRLSAIGNVVAQDSAGITLALTDRSRIPEVAEVIVGGGSALYGLTVHERTLEDLFVASVQGGAAE